MKLLQRVSNKSAPQSVFGDGLSNHSKLTVEVLTERKDSTSSDSLSSDNQAKFAKSKSQSHFKHPSRSNILENNASPSLLAIHSLTCNLPLGRSSRTELICLVDDLEGRPPQPTIHPSKVTFKSMSGSFDDDIFKKQKRTPLYETKLRLKKLIKSESCMNVIKSDSSNTSADDEKSPEGIPKPEKKIELKLQRAVSFSVKSDAALKRNQNFKHHVTTSEVVANASKGDDLEASDLSNGASPNERVSNHKVQSVDGKSCLATISEEDASVNTDIFQSTVDIISNTINGNGNNADCMKQTDILSSQIIRNLVLMDPVQVDVPVKTLHKQHKHGGFLENLKNRPQLEVSVMKEMHRKIQVFYQPQQVVHIQLRSDMFITAEMVRQETERALGINESGLSVFGLHEGAPENITKLLGDADVISEDVDQFSLVRLSFQADCEKQALKHCPRATSLLFWELRDQYEKANTGSN